MWRWTKCETVSSSKTSVDAPDGSCELCGPVGDYLRHSMYQKHVGPCTMQQCDWDLVFWGNAENDPILTQSCSKDIFTLWCANTWVMVLFVSLVFWLLAFQLSLLFHLISIMLGCTLFPFIQVHLLLLFSIQKIVWLGIMRSLLCWWLVWLTPTPITFWTSWSTYSNHFLG